MREEAARAAYTVTDLGTLQGGTVSRATSVNDAGEAAGYSDNGRMARAVLWRSGKMTDLGSREGYGAQAFGINNRGDVVGVAGAHATLWRDGKVIDLDTIGDPRGTHAHAINDAGQIVGSGAPEKDEVARALLWERGRTVNLGTLQGGIYSIARSINNRGEVVGYGHNGEYWGDFAVPRAFVWDAKPGMREIGTLPKTRPKPYSDSFASDINDRGQIVGRSNGHAFLWENGRMRDLGTLPGHSESRANAVNNRGEVVGTSSAPGRGTSFLWRDGRMYDLNSLIPADSGWVLGMPSDINDAGQIVGGGKHDGVSHAYLLTPVRRP